MYIVEAEQGLLLLASQINYLLSFSQILSQANRSEKCLGCFKKKNTYTHFYMYTLGYAHSCTPWADMHTCTQLPCPHTQCFLAVNLETVTVLVFIYICQKHLHLHVRIVFPSFVHQVCVCECVFNSHLQIGFCL